MLSQIFHSHHLKLQWLCLATLLLYLSYASATELKVTYNCRHEYYSGVFGSAHSILIEGVPLSDLDQFFFVLDPWFYGRNGPYEVKILDGVDNPDIESEVGLNVMAVERIVNDLSMLMVHVPANLYKDVTVFRIDLPYDYSVFTDIPIKDAVIGAYQAVVHGVPESVWGIIPRTPFIIPFSAYVVPHLHRVNFYQLVVAFPLAAYPVMSAYPSISLDLSTTIMLSPDSCYSLIVQSRQVCSMLTNHASPLKDPHLPQSHTPLYAFRIDLSNYSPIRINKSTVLPNIKLTIPVREKTDPEMFDYLIPVLQFPALYNVTDKQSLHPRYAVFAASHAALVSPSSRTRAGGPPVIPRNSDSSSKGDIHYENGDSIQIEPVIDVGADTEDGDGGQERIPTPNPGGDDGKDGLIPFYPTASAIEGVLLSSSLRFIEPSSMITFSTSVHAYMSSMATPIFSSMLSSYSPPSPMLSSSSPSPSSPSISSFLSPLGGENLSHTSPSPLPPPRTLSPPSTRYFPIITTPPPFPSTMTDANEAGVLIRVGIQALRKSDVIRIYQDSKAPLFPTGVYACTSGKCTLSPDLEFLECIISENVSQDFTDNGYYQVLITSPALDYSRVGDMMVYHLINGEHVAGSRMHHFGKLHLIDNLRISYTFPKIEEFSVPSYLPPPSPLHAAHGAAMGVPTPASAATTNVSVPPMALTDSVPTRVSNTAVSTMHRTLHSLFTRQRLHTHLSSLSSSSTSSPSSSLSRFPPAPTVNALTAFRLSASAFSLTLTADEFTSGASYAAHRLRIYWPCTLIQSAILPLQRMGDEGADTHTADDGLHKSSSDTPPPPSALSPPPPRTRTAAQPLVADAHLSVSINGLPCYTAQYLTECEVPYGHDDATAGKRRSIEIIAENVYMSVLQRPAVLTITRIHALAPEKVLEFNTIVIPGISKLSIAPTHHLSMAADRKSAFLASNVKITGISPVITPPDDANLTTSPPSSPSSVSSASSSNSSSISASSPSRTASSSSPCPPSSSLSSAPASSSTTTSSLSPSGTLSPASPCFFAIYARTDHLTISFSAPLLANTTATVGDELVTYTPKTHAQLYDTVGKKNYDLSCSIFNNHTLNCVSLADMFVHVHIVPKPDAWITPVDGAATEDNVHVQILVNITSPHALATEKEAAQVYTRFFIYTDTRKDVCHLPNSLPVDRSILTPNLADYYPQLYQHDDPHADTDGDDADSTRVAAAYPSGRASDIARHAAYLHTRSSLPVQPAKGPSTPQPDPYAVDRRLFFTGMSLQRSLDSASVVMYSDPYLLPLPDNGAGANALTVAQIALICVFGGLVLAAGVFFLVFWRRRSHAKPQTGAAATATAIATAAAVVGGAGGDKCAIELTTIVTATRTDTSADTSAAAKSPTAAHRASAELRGASAGTPCESVTAQGVSVAGEYACGVCVEGCVCVVVGEGEGGSVPDTVIATPTTATTAHTTATTAPALTPARAASPKLPRARTPVSVSAQSTALASMGRLMRTLLHSAISAQTHMHAPAQAQNHAGASDDTNTSTNTNTAIDAAAAADTTAATARASPTNARVWSVGGDVGVWTGGDGAPDRAIASTHSPSAVPRSLSPLSRPSLSLSSLSLYPSALYPPNHLPLSLPLLPITSISHLSSPLSFSLAFPIRCKPSASLLLAPDGSLAALVPYLGVYSQDKYRKAREDAVEAGVGVVCVAGEEGGDGSGRVRIEDEGNVIYASGNAAERHGSGDEMKSSNSANSDTSTNTVASASTSATQLACSHAAPASTLVVTHAHAYPSLLFTREAYLLHTRGGDEDGGFEMSSSVYDGGESRRGHGVEEAESQMCAQCQDEGHGDACVRVLEGVSADAQSPALGANAHTNTQQQTQPQQQADARANEHVPARMHGASHTDATTTVTAVPVVGVTATLPSVAHADAAATAVRDAVSVATDGYRHVIPPFYAPARHITVDKHIYYSITFPTQRALDTTQHLRATIQRPLDVMQRHLNPVSEVPRHCVQCSARTGAAHGRAGSGECGTGCGDPASALMHEGCSSPSQVYPRRAHGYFSYQDRCHGHCRDYAGSHAAHSGGDDSSSDGSAGDLCYTRNGGSCEGNDGELVANEACDSARSDTTCPTAEEGISGVTCQAHDLADGACGARHPVALAPYGTSRHGHRHGDQDACHSSSGGNDVGSAPPPAPAPDDAMTASIPYASSLPMLQCKDLPLSAYPALASPISLPSSLSSSLSSSSSCLYSHLQWEQTRIKHSIVLQFTLFRDRHVRRFISPPFRDCLAMIGSDPAYLPCFDAYLLLVLSLAEHESEAAAHQAGLAALHPRSTHAPHVGGVGVGVGACGDADVGTPLELPTGAAIVRSSRARDGEIEGKEGGVVAAVEGVEADVRRKSGKHVHFDDLRPADHTWAPEERDVEVRAEERGEASEERAPQRLRMGVFDEAGLSPDTAFPSTLPCSPTHTRASSSSPSSESLSCVSSRSSPHHFLSAPLHPPPRSLAPEVTINEALHRDFAPVLPRHTYPRPIYTCPRLDVPAHVSTAELSRFANDGDYYIIADDEIVYLSKQRPRVRSNPYHNIKLSSLALAGQIINFVPATAVNYKFFTRAANAPPHGSHARGQPQHGAPHATHRTHAAVAHAARTSANAGGGCVNVPHHSDTAHPRPTHTHLPVPAPALQPAYTIDNTEYRCSPLQYAYSMMQHALMVQGMLPKHTRLGKDASPNALQASATPSHNLQNGNSMKIPYSPFRPPFPTHARVDSDPLEVDMREAFPADPEPENSGMNSGVPRVFSEEMGCTSPTTFVAKQYVRERLMMQAQAQAQAHAQVQPYAQLQIPRGTSPNNTSNATATTTSTCASETSRNHRCSHSYSQSHARSHTRSHSRSQSRAHGHSHSHSCSRSRSGSYFMGEFDRSGSTGDSDSVMHSHHSSHSRGHEHVPSSGGSGLSAPYSGGSGCGHDSGGASGSGSGRGSHGDGSYHCPMLQPSGMRPTSSSTGTSGIRLSGLGASSITASSTGAFSLAARECPLHLMHICLPQGPPQWAAEGNHVAGVAGMGGDGQPRGHTRGMGAAAANSGMGTRHGVGIGMGMDAQPVTMDQIVYEHAHSRAVRDRAAAAAREVHRPQHHHQHQHIVIARRHDCDALAQQQHECDVIAQQELWLSRQEQLRHTHGVPLRGESGMGRAQTAMNALQHPSEPHHHRQQQQQQQPWNVYAMSQSHHDAARDHPLPHGTQHVPHTAFPCSSLASSLPTSPHSSIPSSQAPSSSGPSPNVLFSALAHGHAHDHALPMHAHTLTHMHMHMHMQSQAHAHSHSHSVPQPQPATLSLPSPTSHTRASLHHPSTHAPPHLLHTHPCLARDAAPGGSSSGGTVSLSAGGASSGGGVSASEGLTHDSLGGGGGFSGAATGMAGMGTAASMGVGMGSIGSDHDTNPSNHSTQHGTGATNLSLAHASAPQLHPPLTPVIHGPSHARPHRPHSAHAVAGATRNGPSSALNGATSVSTAATASATAAAQGGSTTAVGAFANPHGMMSLQEHAHAHTQPSLCVPSRADQSPVHLEEILRNSHHPNQHTLGSGIGGFPVHLNAPTIASFARQAMPNGHMMLPTSGMPQNTHAPSHLQPIPDAGQPVFLNDIQNPAFRPPVSLPHTHVHSPAATHVSLPHMRAPQAMQPSHDYAHSHPTFSLLTDLQNLHASRTATDALMQHNPTLCMSGGGSSHLAPHSAAGVAHVTHASAVGSSTNAHVHPHQYPQHQQQQRLPTLPFQQHQHPHQHHHPIYVQHPYIPGMYSLASIQPVPPNNNGVAMPINMHANAMQPAAGPNTHMHANGHDMCRDVSSGTDGMRVNPHLGANVNTGNVSAKSSAPINGLNASLHGGISSYQVPPAPAALQQNTYFPSARLQ